VAVEGRVIGSVHATGKVDFRRGYRVRGNINTSSVASADGSFFEGRIAMPQEPAPEVVAFEKKRRESTDEKKL
jgi:cytoskeletal protein CcmA (bactofilin family)